MVSQSLGYKSRPLLTPPQLRGSQSARENEGMEEKLSRFSIPESNLLFLKGKKAKNDPSPMDLPEQTGKFFKLIPEDT